MQFLDPQNVVYEGFTSLVNLISQFPNLVLESDVQTIDLEYRKLKLDKSVSELFESGGSSDVTPMNTERFWGHIGKITKADGTKKYPNLVDFAKAMMVDYLCQIRLVSEYFHEKCVRYVKVNDEKNIN